MVTYDTDITLRPEGQRSLLFSPSEWKASRCWNSPIRYWKRANWFQAKFGLSSIIFTFDHLDDLLWDDAANYWINRAIIQSISSCEFSDEITMLLDKFFTQKLFSNLDNFFKWLHIGFERIILYPLSLSSVHH